MKLFLKRDISANDSVFTVFDELGKEKYDILFANKNSSVSLKITDIQKNTVATIRRLPIVGTNTFVFKKNKKHITFVIVNSSKGIFCNYYGKNWHIKGEIATKNFSIIDVDNSVIAMQKKIGDALELNIAEDKNELYCISTSICISLINTVDKLAVQAV